MDAASGNNGNIFCTNCGYKLGLGDRFCPECGTLRPEPKPAQGFPPPPPPFQSTLSSQAGYGGVPAPPWPPERYAAAPTDTAADNKPELQFDVDYPDRSSRLLAILRLVLLIGPWFAADTRQFASSFSSLLILPHIIVLTILGIGLFFTTIFSWFAILIVGRYPRSLWDFARSFFRWSTNVEVFATGLRDRYPPFSGSVEYPVQFNLAYPPRLSRLLIFVKWLLAIPHFFILIFVGIAAYFAIIIGWIAVIFTGRFPEGLHGFITGWLRWSARVTVYVSLLTDAYPPFGMSK